MNRTLRTMAFSLIMLLSAALLFATGNAEKANPANVVTLRMVVHAQWVNAGMLAVADIINSHPEKFGYKLEFEKLPEGSQGDDVMATKYATNDYPDVIGHYNIPMLAMKIDPSNFADLSGDWMNNFDKNVISSPAYSFNGKVIAVPLGSTFLFGMLYNKRVFEKAGVSIPTTWAELMAACDKISAIGVTPIILSYKDSWTTQFFGQIPGQLRQARKLGITSAQMAVQLDTNKLHFADMPLFIGSMELEKSLIGTNRINKTYLSDSYNDAMQAILDGTAAMYPSGSWVSSEMVKMDETKFKNDVGGFAIPFDGNDPVISSLPFGLYASLKAKNVAKAVECAKFFGSKEALQAYFGAEKAPTLAMGINVELYPAIKELQDIYQKNGRGVVAPEYIRKYPNGDPHIWMLDYLAGTITAKEVAQKMDEAGQKAAKEAKDPNF
jgi:raffinose/stachyose/melibiose transport system substrate-binding protein